MYLLASFQPPPPQPPRQKKEKVKKPPPAPKGEKLSFYNIHFIFSLHLIRSFGFAQNDFQVYKNNITEDIVTYCTEYVYTIEL